ncbi:Uncharacterized protein PODLI_1B034273 [Podarcis lilfordi]|uniref:ABC1 atypical kinase-like domain-containing protein n=1 Tax=Podarcis lilfordi TaxID=74358 RepID=A0AA35PI41_9SAUR|nr:Uncharacterized protein PODLI_1B034273 [Podarcis lilfordi]
MTTWYCYSTVRIFLSNARILTVRSSLCTGRTWGRGPRLWFFAGEAPSCFPCKALVKTSLVCWGAAGLPWGARCEGAPNGGAQIKGDACLNKGGLSPAGFLQRLGLAFSLVIRACVLLLKFGPLIWLYPLSYVSPGFASLWLHLLLKATESSGPTYIKLGQWASTRRDLFSEEFCAKFSKLHIKVVPHPWGYTQRSLEKYLGEGWEKVFTFDSQEPIGSGCIAQVYKAYVDISALGQPVLKELSKGTVVESALEAWQVSGLKGVLGWLWKRKDGSISEGGGVRRLLPNGGFDGHVKQNSVSGYLDTALSCPNGLVPVAIKVLHPGLADQVQMDLFLMKTGSRLLELLPGVKWLSLTEIVEEFEKLMIQQIDLRCEARNLERFRLNFQGVDYVKFPVPLRPFVTRNILVETYEVFVDNFVHADLHPGNILVQGAEGFRDHPEDRTTIVDLLDTLILEVQPSRPPLRLVLLDAGIIAELQGPDLKNFRAVFTAVVLGQGERVAELILHHSRANQCKDVERFKADMAELVTKARDSTVALGKFQVASLLSSVFKLLMTHQVKLESNFASVVFAIMVLEGLGRSLDPELDILKAAKPFLIKAPSPLLAQ